MFFVCRHVICLVCQCWFGCLTKVHLYHFLTTGHVHVLKFFWFFSFFFTTVLYRSAVTVSEDRAPTPPKSRPPPMSPPPESVEDHKRKVSFTNHRGLDENERIQRQRKTQTSPRMKMHSFSGETANRRALSKSTAKRRHQTMDDQHLQYYQGSGLMDAVLQNKLPRYMIHDTSEPTPIGGSSSPAQDRVLSSPSSYIYGNAPTPSAIPVLTVGPMTLTPAASPLPQLLGEYTYSNYESVSPSPKHRTNSFSGRASAAETTRSKVKRHMTLAQPSADEREFNIVLDNLLANYMLEDRPPVPGEDTRRGVTPSGSDVYLTMSPCTQGKPGVSPKASSTRVLLPGIEQAMIRRREELSVQHRGTTPKPAPRSRKSSPERNRKPKEDFLEPPSKRLDTNHGAEQRSASMSYESYLETPMSADSDLYMEMYGSTMGSKKNLLLNAADREPLYGEAYSPLPGIQQPEITHTQTLPLSEDVETIKRIPADDTYQRLDHSPRTSSFSLASGANTFSSGMARPPSHAEPRPSSSQQIQHTTPPRQSDKKITVARRSSLALPKPKPRTGAGVVYTPVDSASIKPSRSASHIVPSSASDSIPTSASDIIDKTPDNVSQVSAMTEEEEVEDVYMEVDQLRQVASSMSTRRYVPTPTLPEADTRDECYEDLDSVRQAIIDAEDIYSSAK